jgi:hypothetical protein
MAKWENFNFQDFKVSDNFLRPHLNIFDPFTATSRPPICHGQKKFSTATFLENGRRHGIWQPCSSAVLPGVTMDHYNLQKLDNFILEVIRYTGSRYPHYLSM